MDLSTTMSQKRRRSASVSSASSNASSSSDSSSSSSESSLSTPAFKHARPPPASSQGSSSEWTCSLEPTCSAKPQAFLSAVELERHYARVHELACEAVVISSGNGERPRGGPKGKGRQSERSCGCVFPERRLLELHQNELHNPILAELASRGERIYECLLPPALCDHRSKTPKGRRLHMIDKHRYPKEYFFGVVKVGIGQLLVTQGLGASLLRPPHTHSSHAEPANLTNPSPPSLPLVSSLSKPLQPAPEADMQASEADADVDDLDGLASRMAASLAFTPRAVQRKGKAVVK